MSSPIKAHFDGTAVVVDEPAAFEPGEKLLITRLINRAAEVPSENGIESTAPAGANPNDTGRGDDLLQRLARQQNVKAFPDFTALTEGIGGPEEDERDLFEIIRGNREDRRKIAAEGDDPEWLR